MENAIPVFVLTGGPCAGKTTALCFLEEKLRALGYAVFIVPEMATEMTMAGIRRGDGQFTNEEFQELLVRRVLETERFYHSAARRLAHAKKLMLCDRGIMDGLAYIDEASFKALCAGRGMSLVGARDERYDAVFHLRSAAIGAEAFYSHATNVTRRETLEEAREKDAATIAAWIGHPHLRVIDNSTDFAGKLKRLLGEICATLGIPVPMEIERKFRVAESFDPRTIPVPCREVEIEQVYLPTAAPDEGLRIRKRGQDGAYVFYHTHKKRVPDKGAFHSVETERHISEHDYTMLFLARDTARRVIRKKRYCFVWKEQYFELDVFVEPANIFPVLEVEITEKGTAVSLPEFIPVIQELFHFTNEALAAGATTLE